MHTIKKGFIVGTLIAMSTNMVATGSVMNRDIEAVKTKRGIGSYSIILSSLDEAMASLPAIIELSRTAFLKNHEITAYYYEQTEDALKPEFEQLFDDHIIDMLKEIDRQKGFIFLVKDSQERVIGVSVGRPYGCPALSHDFMNRVFASVTHFKEVMKGWWDLMAKYQATPEDYPDHVYHQAMTAIIPEKAGQGIGTQLSKVVMQEITQRGFKALVRETSSTAAHKVAAHLQDTCYVVTIDEQMNKAAKTPVVLRIQFANKDEETARILAWFEGKKR